MDLGLLLGALGIGTAVASALYSRAQALEARRQVEGLQRDAVLKGSRATSDAMLVVRMGIVNTPELMEEYLAANPEMAALYGGTDRIRAVIHLRNYLDVMQDVYFLRKEGIVAPHQWRGWVAALQPFTRMPTFRSMCEGAIQRKSLDDEFLAFLREVLDGRSPPDPIVQRA